MFSLLKRAYLSIAFLPSFLAFCFGLFAVALLISPNLGEHSGLDILTITNKKNIQFILSFVIGGIFTLTIFSYTMVMNVLNRSINNYSPRLIPLLLSQKNHQLILGVTSGTLIYSIILSLFASNSDTNDFPRLGALFAVMFAIICVILFIYFIHSVSQSIHINQILENSYINTRQNLKMFSSIKSHLFLKDKKSVEFPYSFGLKKCGYLQKLQIESLGKIARENNVHISISRKMGEFILEEEHICYTSREINNKLKQKILKHIAVDRSEAMQVPEIGFKHLVEVAVKACSPAINDPGTALSALDYLTQLFIQRAALSEFNCYQKKSQYCLFFDTLTTKELLSYSFTEMKVYMKDDPILMQKLEYSLLKIKSTLDATSK